MCAPTKQRQGLRTAATHNRHAVAAANNGGRALPPDNHCVSSSLPEGRDGHIQLLLKQLQRLLQQLQLQYGGTSGHRYYDGDTSFLDSAEE